MLSIPMKQPISARLASSTVDLPLARRAFNYSGVVVSSVNVNVYPARKSMFDD